MNSEGGDDIKLKIEDDRISPALPVHATMTPRSQAADEDDINASSAALISPQIPAHRRRFKARLFALKSNRKKKSVVMNYSQARTHDYEQRYDEDPEGEETAPEARVWNTYADEADILDLERIETWRDALDVLLVFIGLFSAIVTTFVVQTSQSLQPDYAQATAIITFQALRILASGNLSTVVDITAPNPMDLHAQPTRSDTWVNALWFASLAISLTTALITVLTKQWLYRYAQSTSGTARERARIRQFRHDGLEKYNVALIIDILPLLIHISLALFLAGLSVFLYSLHPVIAFTVAAVTGLGYTLYVTTTLLPLFDPQCPYQSPLTTYLYPLKHHAVALGGARLLSVLQKPKQWLASQLSKLSGMISRIPWSHREHSDLALSLLEEERRTVSQHSDQLDVNAVVWLFTTTSNTTVRSIALQCVGVLPSAHVDTTKLSQIVPSSWYNAFIGCVSDPKANELTIMPGKERTCERLLLALRSLSTPEVTYGQGVFTSSCLAAPTDAPTDIWHLIMPVIRGHDRPEQVWILWLKILLHYERNNAAVQVAMTVTILSYGIPTFVEYGRMFRTARSHTGVRALVSQYLGVPGSSPKTSLPLILSCIRSLGSAQGTGAQPCVFPLISSLLIWMYSNKEFMNDLPSQSWKRDIICEFFQLPILDAAPWTTVSHAVKAWQNEFPAQNITTPLMIGRLMEQFRTRPTPEGDAVECVEEIVNILVDIIRQSYGSHPDPPALLKAMCTLAESPVPASLLAFPAHILSDLASVLLHIPVRYAEVEELSQDCVGVLRHTLDTFFQSEIATYASWEAFRDATKAWNHCNGPTLRAITTHSMIRRILEEYCHRGLLGWPAGVIQREVHENLANILLWCMGSDEHELVEAIHTGIQSPDFALPHSHLLSDLFTTVFNRFKYSRLLPYDSTNAPNLLRQSLHTFFLSPSLDFVSWVTIASATDAWNVSDSSILQAITAPFMVRRILDQFHRREAPRPHLVGFIQEVANNLKHILGQCLSIDCPELLEAMCDITEADTGLPTSFFQFRPLLLDHLSAIFRSLLEHPKASSVLVAPTCVMLQDFFTYYGTSSVVRRPVLPASNTGNHLLESIMRLRALQTPLLIHDIVRRCQQSTMSTKEATDNVQAIFDLLANVVCCCHYFDSLEPQELILAYIQDLIPPSLPSFLSHLLLPLLRALIKEDDAPALPQELASSTRNILHNFFQTSHADFVSWETLSIACMVWNHSDSDTLRSVTTPLMIRRSMKQFAHRQISDRGDLHYVQGTVYNLRRIVFWCLDTCTPKLAEAVCSSICELDMLPTNIASMGESTLLRLFWTSDMCGSITESGRSARHHNAAWFTEWSAYIHERHRLAFLCKHLISLDGGGAAESRRLCRIQPEHPNWGPCFEESLLLLDDEVFLRGMGRNIENPRAHAMSRLEEIREILHVHHQLPSLPHLDENDQILPVPQTLAVV